MIWLIGCKGMLGTEVSNQLEKNNFSWIGTDREVDITNYESLEDFANKNSGNLFPICHKFYQKIVNVFPKNFWAQSNKTPVS